MNKFVNVNIIDALRSIMETNTADFRNDFTYDIDIINSVAKSNDPQDKTVFWLSHFSGTSCNTERQTFMQKTDGHTNWCSFEGYTNERILAYAAEINSVDDSGIITGDLYELNYYAHVAHVRADSLPYDYTVKTIFFKDGHVNQVSAEDLIHFLLYSREDVSHYRNEPENPVRFETLLKHEKESREKSCVIGSLDEHIQRLKDERNTFEAERIATELGRLTEPNSPEKAEFMVKVSPHFILTASNRELQKLNRIIPYKDVKVCSFKGSGDLYVMVRTKEKKQSRKTSVLGQIENGKKVVTQTANAHKNTQIRNNDKEV